MKKINIVWTINLVLLIAIVFLGINSSGRGVEVSKMEREVAQINLAKHQYADLILSYSTTDNMTKKAQELGFLKASNVVYFSSIDVLTSNTAQ